MLSLPTRRFRIKAALALAVIYGFCALAPSLALAVFDNPAVPFCLTGNYLSAKLYAGTLPAHDRVDVHHRTDHAAAHEHFSDHEHSFPPEPSGSHEHPLKGANSNTTDCCGLFPMAGLFGEVDVVFGLSNPVSTPLPALADALHGRGPERINRPPIS
jgi:hypothetical protein